MTQRLENTEKGSKNDITELFARIKRYEEEARIDNDEVRKCNNFFAEAILPPWVGYAVDTCCIFDVFSFLRCAKLCRGQQVPSRRKQ